MAIHVRPGFLNRLGLDERMQGEERGSWIVNFANCKIYKVELLVAAMLAAMTTKSQSRG